MSNQISMYKRAIEILMVDANKVRQRAFDLIKVVAQKHPAIFIDACDNVIYPCGTDIPLEKTYKIVLTGYFDGAKISTIKAVRRITDLGLKEAKDLVESTKDGEAVTLKSGIKYMESAKALISEAIECCVFSDRYPVSPYFSIVEE